MFVQREFSIWDFPDNIYVEIDSQIKEKVFEILYSKFGSRSQYSKNVGVNPADVRKYHLGYFKKQGKTYSQFIIKLENRDIDLVM